MSLINIFFLASPFVPSSLLSSPSNMVIDALSRRSALPQMNMT